MEIVVKEEKKNHYTFEMKNVDWGLCNVLKEELTDNEHVKLATIRTKHPLSGSSDIIVETDGADGRKELSDAAQKVRKKAEKFEKEASSEVK